MAAWSILSGAALPTHDAVILGAEGLLSQRLVTLCTAETLLVPVSALVAELLCFHGDGTVALGAGVGAELCVAANAHRPALVTDEPLPPEVLAAVETLRVFRHRQDTVPPGSE